MTQVLGKGVQIWGLIRLGQLASGEGGSAPRGPGLSLSLLSLLSHSLFNSSSPSLSLCLFLSLSLSVSLSLSHSRSLPPSLSLALSLSVSPSVSLSRPPLLQVSSPEGPNPEASFPAKREQLEKFEDFDLKASLTRPLSLSHN